jgi:mannosyl-oligosaccharide alpha-1,2-mannosidase
LLEVPDVVETSLDHIANIDWQVVTNPGLSIFGSTIRYLGAMLSAYDLLRPGGPHEHLLNGTSIHKVDMLLEQAQSLANILSPSFGTPKGINTNFYNITSGMITYAGINDITALSGLVLEWTHLSDLTGNRTYAELAINSFAPLLKPVPKNPSPFPGLLPKHIDVTTGEFDVKDIGGWSHAGGGMYEMLLKLSIYDHSRFGSHCQKWIQAADSTMKHLASHPRGHPDLTFLADFNGTDLLYQQDHSGMFAAASFILGGIVTGEKRFLDFGLSLVNTYAKIYASTKTGIGPESFGWIPDSCDSGKEKRREVCRVPEIYKEQDISGFVKQAGYWATNTRYLLRPEVLESLYYAYRATKDVRYRELSWEILSNIVQWTKAGSAYAELEDVNRVMTVGANDGRRDWMSSYMLTEVFMYGYIIHLDVSLRRYLGRREMANGAAG